ncbi:TonB-dependent receptor [Bacteroidia bacterium]|nr:TonB-dependent receptor [Bacteroidia bacterium]
MFGQGKIAGTVIEKNTKFPVEYATVEVFPKEGGKPVMGTTSDASGKFLLENIPSGNYELKCSFIGFEMLIPCLFTIDGNNQILNLGILELAESFLNLNEVVISGQKSTYINKIDKKIFNIGTDLMSASGSVSDLMQNIPSVQVDVDGGVSLRGSENVQILINGKPSSMMGTASRASVLQQIPANSIERIEIITNPSAKYKPDGTSGIINIVMKKERKMGVNGTISANAGNADRYNSTLSLNYNPGKINLFAGYGIRFDDRSRYNYDDRTKINSSTGETTHINQKTNSTASPVSHLLRAGIDWEINKKSALQIAGSYTYMRFLRRENTPNIYISNNDTTNYYIRYRHDDEYQKSAELSAVYEYNFGEDHSLAIDYTYSSEKEQEDNKYNNHYFFPSAYESKDNTLIRQSGAENLIRTNYTHPFGENAKIEAGTEIELDKADMNYTAENLMNNAWITDANKTNHFVFDEKIYALYGTYEATLGKFGLMGGLRAEYAAIKSRLISTDTVIPNNYSNIFPTLHTSYKLNENNELQLNYSLRINRPEGDDLNPFPEYKDPLNVHSGNPYLKPEKIHSVELGYQLKEKSTTLLATLYYRNIFNRMTEVSRFVNDSVMWTTKDNLSSSQSSGFEFIVNSAVGNRANINFSTNIFYNTIDTSNLGYAGNKSSISWYASLNGNFNISQNLMVQLNSRYKGKTLTPQGYLEPSFILNMGAKYDLFHKKASVLFTVSDLLNTYKSVTSIDTPELKERLERKRPSQIFYIGFTYNFGRSVKKKETALKYDEQL